MESRGTRLQARVPAELYPRGEFRGRWGGYEAVFDHGGMTYVVETETGVRGQNIPVRILIRGTEIEVKEV